MKQFLKYTLATIVGVLIVVGILLFFFAGLAASGAPDTAIKSNSVLHLKFDNIIPELTDNIPSGQFGASPTSAVGLNDITRLLKTAAEDSKIKGILLQSEAVPANPTTAYSIARSLEAFKTSGKFVLGYGNYFSQSGYIIAATADTLHLNPNGVVDMRGYGMTIPYYEDFSQKTGIDFDVYHAGRYKSAIEPFYRDKASDDNRYQTHAYLQDYHDALADHIADCRNLDTEAIDQVITQGLSNNADDAIKYRLVDTLSYFDDLKDEIADRLNTTDVNYVKLEEYHLDRPKPSVSNNNKVAVIYAEGEVAGGGEARGSISMDVYDEIFDRLEKNDKVKAVVLRVNSPGGSSFTSDRFWKRVKDLSAQGKYVVASFGDYAASGGYYVAAAAEKIITEPTTLTGSIGVFSMIPDLKELSEEELGIYWDTISTGKRTFLYSSFVSRSAADNALLKAETERIYQQFKEVVADGRGMTVDAVHEVAQGRVWSGIDAMETGLVDTLGSLQDAIAIAARAVSYDDYKVLEYPIIEKTFYEKLLEGFANNVSADFQPQYKLNNPIIQQLMEQVQLIDQACQTPQARLPLGMLTY